MKSNTTVTEVELLEIQQKSAVFALVGLTPDWISQCRLGESAPGITSPWRSQECCGEGTNAETRSDHGIQKLRLSLWHRRYADATVFPRSGFQTGPRERGA